MEIFKSVFGFKLAVILCLSLLINSVFLYSLTIKWFYEELLPRLYIIIDREHLNKTSNNTISFKLEITSISWSIEAVTSLAYSISLVISRIWFRRFNLKNKFNFMKLVFSALFYAFTTWILIYALTNYKIKMNCEHFFKNRQNVSNHL